MDDNTFKLLSLLVTGLMGVATAYIGFMAKRAGDNSKANGEKIKDVQITASNTQRMGEAVHTLVNSNMGVQLSTSAAALQRVADITGDPQDVEIAEGAKRLLDDHVSRQAVVDSKPPPTATASGLGTGTPASDARDEAHVADPSPDSDP